MKGFRKKVKESNIARGAKGRGEGDKSQRESGKPREKEALALQGAESSKAGSPSIVKCHLEAQGRSS